MSTVRVARNDWSTIAVPELPGWQPELTVSVVIPAYNCQASLDLTLASLAAQTYPARLLEVVVVDDGSDPPLVLPKIRPERCRLIPVPTGWGRANALHLGAQHADGEIIHWLDADMVVFPEHVAAQARWHHQLPYAVTLGWKRFVDTAPDRPDWPTPDEVAAGAQRLFAGHHTEPHDYVERLIVRTDQLRAADHECFLIHVGATAALRRELYEAAGGLNPRLRLAEDTELGYRLAQAGAVFVPEPEARSWHLGTTHMMKHESELQRYNRPYLADLLPQPRWLRKVGGTGWTVPRVTAVMAVDGQPLERVRAAVDALLTGDEPDLRLLLVGDWDALSDRRSSPLADPLLDLRLIAASYHADPRVKLVDRAPESVFPSPYLLRVPATAALPGPALHRLLEYADRHRLGLLQVSPGPPVELWRTAALARADWVRNPAAEPLAEAVAGVWGRRSLAAGTVGVRDLAGYRPEQLVDGLGLLAADGPPPGKWLPSSVEVAGVRSLAKAAVVVGRLSAARATTRLRTLVSPAARRERRSRRGR